MAKRRDEARHSRGHEKNNPPTTGRIESSGDAQSTPPDAVLLDRETLEALQSQIANLTAANRQLRGKIRELQSRTASFLNNPLIVAWLKDDQGRYEFISSEFARRFGACQQDWLGKTDDEMWPAELAQSFKEHDDQVLQTGEPLEVMEDAVYADGTRGHFLALKFPIIDESGRCFVGGLGIDITARVEAENALAESQERLRLAARTASFGTEELEKARRAAEAANEAKSIFLANMSHEIRTPMTAILGFADVLQSRLTDRDALSCVRTIRENGKYLCDLLNDLIDLSKIELGRITVRVEPISLVALLAEIRSLMTVRAAAKGLDLTAEIVGQIPSTIQGDRKLIRQVLVNLVGNAIKFTEQGEVRIIARALPDRRTIEIAVSDTGIGIAEQDISTVFLPFEQLDNSFTRKAGGTGLGLAICQELVAMLGGELSVDSTPGEGATFRFTFDAGETDDVSWITPDRRLFRDAMPSEAPEPAPTIQGHVLAADDRPEIRELLREYLESAGAHVDTAADGQQAVDAYLRWQTTATPIEAVLMDVQMPTMDGLEATRRLRADGFDGPIIAVTANAMRRDRERCLQAGVDEFLSKPIDRNKLLQKLSDCLDHRRGLVPAKEQPPLAILCVDDNEATRLSQQIVLEDRGHRVETAATAKEALEVADRFTPDVAIIDLGLRGASGGELLAELKTRPELQECFFVCLTGRNEEESSWQRLGFDAFVQKPVGVDALMQAVVQAGGRN